jgi:putative ABC transport system ATP-binding protein
MANQEESARGTVAASPDNTTEPLIIQGIGLTRIYDVGLVSVTGIADIDLSIVAGQLVVLKGDSGSGKSTLLSLIAGLDRLTSGKLSVAGYDLNQSGESELTEFRRSQVGMIFQAFNLLPTLNVRENVCLPALLAGCDHGSTQSKAEDLLDWLGLRNRLTHRPHQLSGGEMQRTAIARALINDPAIVIADEPTGNLDSANARRVMALLADLNCHLDRTVIIATHSDLADPFATTMLRLQDGCVSDQ